MNFTQQFLGNFGLKRGEDEFISLVVPDDELNRAVAQITQTIKQHDVRLGFFLVTRVIQFFFVL
jgi:hypothetical protein